MPAFLTYISRRAFSARTTDKLIPTFREENDSLVKYFILLLVFNE